ncbi:MAG: c-type cytochrome [Flavobacteriales bacterium]|nr:c-type cytochrome [Flavobacteriales bacterium]
MSKITSVFLLSMIFMACEDDDAPADTFTESMFVEIPDGFPALDFPEDNAFSEERYVLGKKLFFDPILSRDSSVSCGSCHRPSRAFGDMVPLSNGVGGAIGNRNSPSLANIGYHPYFLREGGVPTLEMQVLVPIQEHSEFDFNVVLIAERLAHDPIYTAMCQKAYGRDPDPFCITRAISTFERTLVSGDSRYDQYAFQGDISALTSAEINGMDLFFSEDLACSSCHSGFNFTNYSFENNGLYEVYLDKGRALLTNQPDDEALFKVPTLRNVGLTAPYMHDGSMETLLEVILHYESGGVKHVNKSPEVKGFELTNQERKDLIAFLNSLSDYEFINDPNHQP